MNFYRSLMVFTLFACFFASVAGAGPVYSDLYFAARSDSAGMYSLTISAGLQPDAVCLLFYAEPGDVLICAIIDPDAGQDLVGAIEKLGPLALEFNKLDNCNLKVEIAWRPVFENKVSVRTATLDKNELIQNGLANVVSNTLDPVEFVIETDSTGCFSMGRCGTGRPFWGPVCDPCIFTVCCYGSTGFIICEETLCP
ncbi:hypothetical protein JW823_09050 [bacterium]|nr:hypothetical protein [candidate division CSSED10-310 bacterium]